MNSGNENEWEKYKTLVKKLNKLCQKNNKLNGKIQYGFKSVAKNVKTLLRDGKKEPSKMDEDIVNTILEIEDELLKIRKEQIEKGPKYRNLIDTKKFVCFISEKNNTEKIKRHIRDHFDTLVIQRNAILSKSLDINPYFSILGLMIQVAAMGGAACFVIIVGVYLMVTIF